MTDNGFCKGVEILLGRMHSHPDDFFMGITGDNYGNTWRDICCGIVERKTGRHPWEANGIEPNSRSMPLPTLSDEEVDALYARLMEIQKIGFDQEIVRRVVLSSEDKTRGMLEANTAKLPYIQDRYSLENIS